MRSSHKCICGFHKRMGRLHHMSLRYIEGLSRDVSIDTMDFNSLTTPTNAHEKFTSTVYAFFFVECKNHERQNRSKRKFNIFGKIRPRFTMLSQHSHSGMANCDNFAITNIKEPQADQLLTCANVARDHANMRLVV